MAAGIYNHRRIEKKWRAKWDKTRLYCPNLRGARRPFYNLMMFPYPSAEGLHIGNMYAFSGSDIYGRFKRMSGYDVFEPIGLDGFGIHSENYAIKIGKHPKENAKVTEKNFYRQLQEIGNSFAWDYRLETYNPDYYRWTQWLFVKLFKAGLAYRGKASVNWCPSCKTVLADEQVEQDVCERCKNKVERRQMSSWFFRITDYADRLLRNIDGTSKRSKDPMGNKLGPVESDYQVKRFGLKWPEKIKIAQRSWIGKKEGINITYPIKGTKEKVTCFTTRPDTNFGATFVVISPEYTQKILGIIPHKVKNKVAKYVKTALNKSEKQRLEEGRKKTGVFTGLYAVNQLNNCEMPIWVADFVLSGVGTGAVVGVPGHDKRDFEFAEEFGLPTKRVVVGSDGDKSEIVNISQVQEGEGTMINSEFLDGLGVHEATKKIMGYLEKKGWGKKVFNYHLRDWLISRQRYWGPPIPMVYCKKCFQKGRGWFDQNKASLYSDQSDWESAGWYPVLEDDLPVALPDIEKYKPKGDGTSPLSNAPDSWKSVKCPACGSQARRELDVSDTFLDSSWYFLAYPNLKSKEWQNRKTPFNQQVIKKWFPVDAYIGGAEHAVLHLLYVRFITMALCDLDYLDFEEPFPFLFSHGLIIKDGVKMSKSKGNVINPDDYIDKFGADALRCYLMFLGPYDSGGDFRDTGMEGMYKFLMRVWNLYVNYQNVILIETHDSKEVYHQLHRTIKKCTRDIEQFKYNTALSSLMEFVNLLKAKAQGKVRRGKGGIKCAEWDESLRVLVKLLAPFAPFMAEEIWNVLLGEKSSVHHSAWPEYSDELTQSDEVEVIIQVNGKLRGQLVLSRKRARNKNEVIKLAGEDEKIKKWLKGNKIKKEIFVPGRLINFVI